MSAADPWGAPGRDAVRDPEEEDPFASVPTTIGRFAGVAALMAGGTLVTGAVQQFTIFYLAPPQYATVSLMLVVGLGLLGTGPAVMKSRGAATVIATLLAGLGALLTGGWAIYALVYGGTLSLLLLFGVPMAGLALLLGAVSIGPAARVTAARARLYQ